jgi:hypothetical protein
LIARKKFTPTHFRVFSHDDWAAKHKGRCTAKVQYPWTGAAVLTVGIRSVTTVLFRSGAHFPEP